MNLFRSIIGFLGLSIIAITSANGQSFDLSKDTSTLAGDAGSIIKVKNSINNLTDDSIEFRWVRGSNSLPSEWQKSGVCDKNKCYNDADSATFVLADSANGPIDINFYPFDDSSNPINGTATLKILIYPVDSGRSNAKEAFFKASTTFNSISSSQQTHFSLYPNPASEVLTVETPFNGDQKVAIYNNSGMLVKSINFTGNGKQQINIHELPKGIYHCRVRSQSLNQKVKTFIKH